MLEEHPWGLAIPVSQIACEGPSKTHLAWGAWGGPVEKLLRLRMTTSKSIQYVVHLLPQPHENGACK
jgi:hypothetical protein